MVLIGASMTTNDELQAFGCSVDIVVSLSDLGNLKPVLRRGVNRAAAFYAPLQEALAAHQSTDNLRTSGRPAASSH